MEEQASATSAYAENVVNTMKSVKNLLLVNFILAFFPINTFAHKDRIVGSEIIILIFTENDTIYLKKGEQNNFENLMGGKHNSDKNLEKAIIKYETGEKLIFEYSNAVLIKLQLTFKNKTIEIPKDVSDKFSLIPLNKVYLLWYGETDIPFKSKYFYFRFINAKDGTLEEMQVVRLMFTKKRFSEASFGSWKGGKSDP